MTPAKKPEKRVRYGLGTREQGWLRLALVEAWDYRCSWCRTAGATDTHFETDHIVPQENFESAKAEYGLPAEFAVDSLENLAPICTAGMGCNRRKSDSTFRHSPLILTVLRDASKKAPDVERTVNSFRSARGLRKSLAKIVTADFNGKTREALADHSRALIQRLSEVGRELPQMYDEIRWINLGEIDMGDLPECFAIHGTREGEISLPLDLHGRNAAHLLEVLCGRPVDSMVQSALNELCTKVDADIFSKGQRVDARYDIWGARDIVLLGLEHSGAAPAGITFTLKGTYSSRHTASPLWRPSPSEELELEVDGSWSFNLELSGSIGELNQESRLDTEISMMNQKEIEETEWMHSLADNEDE